MCVQAGIQFGARSEGSRVSADGPPQVCVCVCVCVLIFIHLDSWGFSPGRLSVLTRKDMPGFSPSQVLIDGFQSGSSFLYFRSFIVVTINSAAYRI